MHVPIRILTDDAGCVSGYVDAAAEASISASVGYGGANRPDDVLTIQDLLNGVGPESGGPAPSLEVDGLVGQLTIGAINRFQSKQFGWSDGRVDPGANTIRRL